MSLLDARQHVTNPEGRFKVPKANIVGKAAHHSVSGGSFFMAGETTEQDEINHIRMIDQYHVSIDFGGFAYQACAFASSRAYQTGDFDGARAHIWGRNHELLGWVLVGNYYSQLPPSGAMTAAAECERAFDAYLGRQVPLRGHMDWALLGHGTACPGRIRERLTTIRNLAKEDDMLTLVQDSRGISALLGPYRVPLSPDHLEGLMPTAPRVVHITDEQMDKIPEVPQLTLAQIKGLRFKAE